MRRNSDLMELLRGYGTFSRYFTSSQCLSVTLPTIQLDLNRGIFPLSRPALIRSAPAHDTRSLPSGIHSDFSWTIGLISSRLRCVNGAYRSAAVAARATPVPM